MGDSGRFRHKEIYKTLTRTSYCQCTLRAVLAGVFSLFNWTDIALIADTEDVFYNIMADSIQNGLQEREDIFPFRINFQGKHNPRYKFVLQGASRRARGTVVFEFRW